MTTTSVTAENKGKTADKQPTVKDAFLDDLIKTFGYEKGVTMYQSDKVTKEDLTSFLALLAKFDPNKRIVLNR